MNGFSNFVTGTNMHLAKREWRVGKGLRAFLGAIAFGGILGVTGPFGSQSAFIPAVRYSFWMVMALVGFGATIAAIRLLEAALAGQGRSLRILCIAVASAIPMTFFVAWALGVVQPGRSFSPLQLAVLLPFVALVQAPIAWLNLAQGTDATANLSQKPDEHPAYPREFLAKLPIALREDILALEAEDHYLRVHSLHGSALLLMRLADAAALIDQRLGMRVHRSWWVASDAVATLEKNEGKSFVCLRDGTRVPISRSHQANVRAAWSDKV